VSVASRHPPIPSAPPDAWWSRLAPPELDLPQLDRGAIREVLRAGDREAENVEAWLASAARGRGAVDLAIGEGLAALRVGDRLAELGYHLGDYAREVLGIDARTALKLAHLARELRSRPLLRAALRSGTVRLRAAEVVLPVAVGEGEAYWVDRARAETVRALEAAVARAKATPLHADEEWLRFRVGMRPEEREVLDEALEVAGRVLSGSRRAERLEAMAQEFLGAYPALADDSESRPLGGLFRTTGQRADADARRRAELEAETDRWAFLPRLDATPLPECGFDALTTAAEIDARLRELASYRARWDDAIGWFAHVLRQSRLHELLGFQSFRHYCDERLGLPARTVETRAALEQRIWQVPALRDARRQGLSYEKLRALSHLPDREIVAWVPRACTMTCIALRRALEAAEERQMRARRRFTSPVRRSVADLLAAAIRTVRALSDTPVTPGRCLAIIAQHFLDVWAPTVKRRSRSQRIRERDAYCMVPGCSHGALHAHHVTYRARGGGDEIENLVGLCAFHHLRCIHGGWLRVWGTAPDGLTWELRGSGRGGSAL
jgi:5-methylcytosine-specific restriction endonuclease McrA